LGRKYGLAKYGAKTYDLGVASGEIWVPIPIPPFPGVEAWTPVPDSIPPCPVLPDTWMSASMSAAEIWKPIIFPVIEQP